MDKRFTFNGHVNRVSQRSYLRLKSLYEFKHMLSVSAEKNLTESLVLSIPGYLDTVYGPFLTAFNKYRIQKIQNSCVRFVHALTRRDHVSQHIVNTWVSECLYI